MIIRRVAILLTVSFASLLVGTAAQSESRISGTYVTRAANGVDMLQLTEGPGGQVSGVMSTVGLSPSGRIESYQVPVSGTIGDGTIILTLHGGPLSTFPNSVAGTIRGDTIELQALGSDGTLDGESFLRSDASAFQEAAQQLKARGDVMKLSANLTKDTTTAGQSIRAIEAWMADATARLQHIASVKDRYHAISRQMQSLVERERITKDSLARSDLHLAVIDGQLAGDDADAQVNQVWDRLFTAGQKIAQLYQQYHRGCATGEELRAKGAAPEIVQRWESACGAFMAEEVKFDPVYSKVSQERASLKAFQAEEKQKRDLLLVQATQLN